MAELTKRSRVTILLLSFALIAQVLLLARDSIYPTLVNISTVIGESAIMRSAILFHGEGFADYIAFVREQVPENARVLLPPNRPVQPMANLGLMQFYLFPRELHNCGSDEVEACILRQKTSDLYILTAWKFPPPDITVPNREFVHHRDGSGIYVPLP